MSAPTYAIQLTCPATGLVLEWSGQAEMILVWMRYMAPPPSLVWETIGAPHAVTIGDPGK